MRFCASILALLVAAPAMHAAGKRLELKDLVAEALVKNPEILAAQKSYEAARQRPRQQSSLPDPTVSIGYQSNGNPLPGAGLGRDVTSNIGLMLTQEFPYPGKRGLRGEVAGKEADAAFQEYQLVALSVVSRVKQAYHRLHHTYAAVEVLDHNRELLKNLLRITEARYSVGKAAQQDVFKVQTQISLLEVKVLQQERERRAREAEINSLLNRPPNSPVDEPVDMPAEHLPVSLEQLQQNARQDSPLLMRDQKRIERNELALNLSRKSYYPDTAITGGYFNQGSLAPMYVFRADVKVPLYFFRKQRAEVTEQVETLAESRHTFEAEGQSLLYRIKDDYLTAETSERLMKMYLNTILPQARLAVESSLASYESGTVDFLSVLNNYLMVLEYEMDYHEEMLNFFLAVSRLGEMTGLSLME